MVERISDAVCCNNAQGTRKTRAFDTLLAPRMTIPSEPSPQPPVEPAASGPDASGTLDWNRLPVVVSPLGPAEAMEKLRLASKRGRMPGFEQRDGGSFTVELFGTPWDRLLQGVIAAEGSGSKVSFVRKDKRLLPGVWLAALVLSVWPGVLLTDALIPASWGWIGTHVWAWYLPLTIIGNVWTWIWAVRKADATTRASAAESIPAIAAEISGRVGA